MKHLCIVAIASLMFAGPLMAQDDSRSAAPAAQLTRLLDERDLQAFAAEHPKSPGRFAAVLYFPGAQLLLIFAEYSAPSLLRDRIAAGEYRQVYIDLSSAGERTNRLFVEDLGAPGLRPTRDEGKSFDLVWRDVTNGIHYDGNAAAQKLSKSAYHSRFEADDAAYAELLEILKTALTSPAPAHGASGPAQP